MCETYLGNVHVDSPHLYHVPRPGPPDYPFSFWIAFKYRQQQVLRPITFYDFVDCFGWLLPPRRSWDGADREQSRFSIFYRIKPCMAIVISK